MNNLIIRQFLFYFFLDVERNPEIWNSVIEFLSLRYNTLGVKIDTSDIKFSERSVLA